VAAPGGERLCRGSRARRREEAHVVSTRRRLPLWAALALAGSASLIAGHVISATAADDVYPVEIEGVGDSDWAGELVPWQNEMYDATQSIDLSYTSFGSKEGRRYLLSGLADFTVGGVPFTEAELAAHPDLGEIIEVPISEHNHQLQRAPSTREAQTSGFIQQPRFETPSPLRPHAPNRPRDRSPDDIHRAAYQLAADGHRSLRMAHAEC